jgi:membrane fusion protein (multidrug efflux system)
MNESAPFTRASRRGRLRATVIPVAAGALFLTSLDACSKPQAVAEVMPVLVRQVSGVNRYDLVVLSGDVEASRSGNLGFQVPGRVVRVWPEEGEIVQAGEPLAQLDTTEYHLQLVMASAQAHQAEDQFKRLQQMYDKQGIPPADFVKMETGLQQARAQMALVQHNLLNTRLVASLGGAVARRGIEVGEMAAPGMPVFTIIATDPVQIRAGVPEAEVGRIRVGQKAEIRVPALPNKKFYGTVKLIGAAADPMSRTFTVKITVPNSRRLLRPGMIAEARIQQDNEVNAITIPASAIVRDPDGATQVFAYNPVDKRVYARRITVGTVYGKEVEVMSGLTSKEIIVVGGQHRVREGSKVEATTSRMPDVAMDNRTVP